MTKATEGRPEEIVAALRDRIVALERTIEKMEADLRYIARDLRPVVRGEECTQAAWEAHVRYRHVHEYARRVVSQIDTEREMAAPGEPLRQQLDELLRALDRLKWRPIETAPRDGTVILAWSPHSHIDPGGRADLFNWLNGDWSGYASYGRWPTHWMPLPDGPEGTA